MTTQNQAKAESAIHYPLGEALPELGSTIELAPGVRWLRMKLPFALDHINLWLLRDEIDGISGWTIVDCVLQMMRLRRRGKRFLLPS